MVTSLAEVWIETSSCNIDIINNAVTSLAEVWIETENHCTTALIVLSLPLRKCGLKLNGYSVAPVPIVSLPLRKCGLKHTNSKQNKRRICHFPCGSVDWNSLLSTNLYAFIVTSLAEVWIETSCLPYPETHHHVTSLAEVWIETHETVELIRNN